MKNRKYIVSWEQNQAFEGNDRLNEKIVGLENKEQEDYFPEQLLGSRLVPPTPRKTTSDPALLWIELLLLLLLPISRRELFLTGVLLLCAWQRNEVPRLEDHRHQFWSDPLPPLTNYAIVPLCYKNQFPGNKDSLPNENFNILFWMTGDVCSTNNAFSHHQCVGAILEDTILLIINCQRFLSKCAPSGDTTISAVNIFLPPIHPLLQCNTADEALHDGHTLFILLLAPCHVV